MGRKVKYSPEQKVIAYGDYLSGRKSAAQIARELGMKKTDDVMEYNHVEWTKFTVE